MADIAVSRTALRKARLAQEAKYEPQEGDLRVWHVPQIPGEPFTVQVRGPQVRGPEEAKLVLDVLADYDLFQFEQRVKGDFNNAQGLERFESGEWSDGESE